MSPQAPRWIHEWRTRGVSAAGLLGISVATTCGAEFFLMAARVLGPSLSPFADAAVDAAILAAIICPVLYFTVFRPLTNRAEALAESERLLRNAQRVGHLGTYTLDMASGSWTSSEVLDEIFGIDDSFVRSVDGWLDLVHPDWRAAMHTYFEDNVLGSRERFDREYRIVRKCDGRELWVHGLGELEFDGRGEPARMLGTIQDITERKLLAEQFQQAQKMEAIGQLAGGVAHDFNNILGAILMETDLALTSPRLVNDQAVESLREIKGATLRASALTAQLLQVSRTNVVKPTVIDVNESVTSMAKMLLRLLGEDVSLALRLHPSPVLTFADRGALDQVLMNLAVNARDAMPGGGQLVIETGVAELTEDEAAPNIDVNSGSFVVVTVRDSGTGIPAEVLPRIFEPFFTTKEQGKGTGLGLATVFGIVKQHHGAITVSSHDGLGTEFRVLFPRTEGSPEPDTKESGEPPDSKASETLLLVEDNDVLRSATRRLLEQHGYSVVEAHNGPAALEAWTSHPGPIPLVISDFAMPGGMTGLELLIRLREDSPGVKVIITTGYSQELFTQSAVLGDGDRLLQKPFQSCELLDSIRRVLDS